MERLVWSLKASIWHITIRNEELFEQELLLTIQQLPPGTR
jgi:hypothetical protein